MGTYRSFPNSSGGLISMGGWTRTGWWWVGLRNDPARTGTGHIERAAGSLKSGYWTLAAIRTLLISRCGFVSCRSAMRTDFGSPGDQPGQPPVSAQTAIHCGQAGSGPSVPCRASQSRGPRPLTGVSFGRPRLGTRSGAGEQCNAARYAQVRGAGSDIWSTT